MSIALALALLAPGSALAKRSEPAKVDPVVYKGIRYTAPNDDGRRAYIRATDVQTGKTLYDIEIFRNKIDPALEEDVQWVFIKKLEIQGRLLVITDEKNRVWTVDLKTRKVGWQTVTE